MPGVLNIVAGDTKATKVQFQSSGTAIDITANTLLCRIATDPTTEVAGIITAPLNGEATFALGVLSAGTYSAEVSREDLEGSQTSDLFTINVRNAL